MVGMLWVLKEMLCEPVSSNCATKVVRDVTTVKLTAGRV